MPETTLVGVRVHSWQWFKFEKWAKGQNLHLGQALTEAVKEFLAIQNIPQATIDTWLSQYREENNNEVD